MGVVPHLILAEPGLHVGKHRGRLRVTRVKSGEKILDAPLVHLESVLIIGRGISMSSNAVHECVDRGIPIYFVSATGKPYGTVYSSRMVGTVQTRRQQLYAYDDRRGRHLARAFALGKVRNQIALVRYALRYKEEQDAAAAQEVRRLLGDMQEALVQLEATDDQDVTLARLRLLLLNLEGRAANAYWQAFGFLLNDQPWPGRRHRGATDPVNAALNYGYGILYGVVERACLLAGLDPYAGYLHTDRPGKPSLVLDLIEEFRPVAVDRTVLAFFNRGRTVRQDSQGLLDRASRKALAEAVLETLARPHRYHDERLRLESIIQRQARRVATYVRQEREAYQPYRFRW